MTNATARIALSGLLVAAFGRAAAAQAPQVVNGSVTTVSVGSPFPQAFRSLVSSQTELAWIGYAAPVVDPDRLLCCDGPGRGTGGAFVSGGGVQGNGMPFGACRLESAPTAPGSQPARAGEAALPAGPVRLEGSARIAVLFRIVGASVERIRVVSTDCVLDAGGRPLHWIDAVPPADSVALLESYAAAAAGSGRVIDGAMAAIALHRDESADRALERLVGADHPDTVRRKVTFWLGNARGRPGFDRLLRLMREDPSVEVRKSAVFGISQSPVPEKTDTLASIARTDKEPRLRREALFWLAQAAGRKAAETITERIDQDPDTEVKKKAVFALSQLPRDEGVPLLISVARTNTNPAVRKQAMFWLGESRDPRAIDFFAEILK
ncbi:MAG: hypothetical protein V7647_2095 [Acidobacteriota bacterium]|jgi:hypothetical protein